MISLLLTCAACAQFTGRQVTLDRRYPTDVKVPAKYGTQVVAKEESQLLAGPCAVCITAAQVEVTLQRGDDPAHDVLVHLIDHDHEAEDPHGPGAHPPIRSGACRRVFAGLLPRVPPNSCPAGHAHDRELYRARRYSG